MFNGVIKSFYSTHRIRLSYHFLHVMMRHANRQVIFGYALKVDERVKAEIV